MNYKFSEKAIEDLKEIWSYTKKTWSEEQADRYYELLVDECESIADHFYEIPEFQLTNYSLKRTKVKSHYIYFELNKFNEVQINRILHERMDIKYQLFD